MIIDIHEQIIRTIYYNTSFQLMKTAFCFVLIESVVCRAIKNSCKFCNQGNMQNISFYIKYLIAK